MKTLNVFEILKSRLSLFDYSLDDIAHINVGDVGVSLKRFQELSDIVYDGRDMFPQNPMEIILKDGTWMEWNFDYDTFDHFEKPTEKPINDRQNISIFKGW